MPYKAFFVEDEIVTREGIRDNVDWKGNGFEFAARPPTARWPCPCCKRPTPTY